MPRWLRTFESRAKRAVASAAYADGNELMLEWVVPIAQPVVWLFQPPRSGGTMLLRLFDCHPEMHVHPAPTTVHWPPKPKLEKIEQSFSLARYNGVGFKKSASNRAQQPVPIYFDEKWYHAILANAHFDSPRNVFDSASTARFNAWRNYQNLYGQPKRYQLLHSTIWQRTPVDRMVKNFFTSYPDGYMIFIARCPEDWLASGAKLEASMLNHMETACGDYVAAYEAYEQSRRNAPERMFILNFDRLVTEPKAVLSRLCDRLGIAYHSALETTTINGIPMAANSSHTGEDKYAPDPSRIGWGVEIKQDAQKLRKFDAAGRLFETLCSSSQFFLTKS